MFVAPLFLLLLCTGLCETSRPYYKLVGKYVQGSKNVGPVNMTQNSPPEAWGVRGGTSPAREALRALNEEKGACMFRRTCKRLLVLVAGIEPARCCHHGILSPGRLPIPPYQPVCSIIIQYGGGLVNGGGRKSCFQQYLLLGRGGNIRDLFRVIGVEIGFY